MLVIFCVLNDAVFDGILTIEQLLGVQMTLFFRVKTNAKLRRRMVCRSYMETH